MTEQELQQQRAIKWRTSGNAVRTVEDARSFVQDVGFCLVYPVRSLVVPTFIGAYAGSAEGLPEARLAFSDPRTQPALDLMVRLLRGRDAFELNLQGDIGLLVSASAFPYFYLLAGDKSPKGAPKFKADGTRISPLAIKVFRVLQQHGPLNKKQLRDLVGHEPAPPALDRALSDLWTILKITRVDYRKDEGALWDVFYRWAQEAIDRSLGITFPEALTALLSKYVESAIAVGQEEIERFFSTFMPRQKIREGIHALQAGRQVSFFTAGAKTLIRMTPLIPEFKPAATPTIKRRRTFPKPASTSHPGKDKTSKEKDLSDRPHVNQGLRRRG